MAAVLQIMDSNFSAEFQESEAYKNLQRVVDEEAEELERLRQVILFFCSLISIRPLEVRYDSIRSSAIS